MNKHSIITDYYDERIQIVRNYLVDKKSLEEITSNNEPYSEGRASWKGKIQAGGKEWEIYLILPEYFPDDSPKIIVPEADSIKATNPHVMSGGALCILPDTAVFDTRYPIKIIEHCLAAATEILCGTTHADFQHEFSSYWNRTLGKNPVDCLIIDSPTELPMMLQAVFCDDLVCVSKSNENIKKWCRNFLDKDSKIDSKESGLLIPLDEPLTPNLYPNSLWDLRSLVHNKGTQPAKLWLDQIIINTNEDGFVLLSQKTETGYALAGIRFRGLKLKARKTPNGFRKGKVPNNILLAKATVELKRSHVVRCMAKRVDHDWIHTRGGDGELHNQKSAMVIGCGSLGGYVAHFLATAGVQNLTLLDNDTLEWANLGRHILGAESVSRFKAVAMSDAISRQMPHLTVKGIPKDWRDALKENDRLFDGYDIIIITVADWRCEAPLNRLSFEANLPPLIHGWLEPFAVAGHCLISVREGGCLACGMDEFGRFEKRVALFGSKTLRRESGGCTHYQQYGPTSLMPVASLIASTALTCLRSNPTSSILRTWISDQEHLKSCNAEINPFWEERVRRHGFSRIYDTKWELSNKCRLSRDAK